MSSVKAVAEVLLAAFSSLVLKIVDNKVNARTLLRLELDDIIKPWLDSHTFEHSSGTRHLS